MQAHYNWLEEQLAVNSIDPNVRYLAVTLHHPVFTKTALKQHLLPLLRKYKVDIIFVGHEHWSEYTNMAKDYQIRFPNDAYGEIINDCSGEKEILIHKEREQTFKRGEHIHLFLVGNGGAYLRYVTFCK